MRTAQFHSWARRCGGVAAGGARAAAGDAIDWLSVQWTTQPQFQDSEAWRRGLGEQGYSEGRNVTIEYHWADNQYERLPALASDLVGRRVSVIYAAGLVSALAAQKATDTIPIVFGVGADPVKSGLVTSFNKPNGNATGVAILIESLGPKRLGLVNELLPDVRVIGILFNSTNPTAEAQLEELRTAARAIGLSLQVVSIHDKGHDLEEAFTLSPPTSRCVACCARPQPNRSP